MGADVSCRCNQQTATNTQLPEQALVEKSSDEPIVLATVARGRTPARRQESQASRFDELLEQPRVSQTAPHCDEAVECPKKNDPTPLCSEPPTGITKSEATIGKATSENLILAVAPTREEIPFEAKDGESTKQKNRSARAGRTKGKSKVGTQRKLAHEASGRPSPGFKSARPAPLFNAPVADSGQISPWTGSGHENTLMSDAQLRGVDSGCRCPCSGPNRRKEETVQQAPRMPKHPMTEEEERKWRKRVQAFDKVGKTMDECNQQ